MKQRLSQLNLQFAPQNRKSGGAKRQTLKPIVANVWESMGMDQYLSQRAVNMRKATAQVMDECYKDLLPFVESAEFPRWLPQKLKPLGINGLQIKGYGSAGLSTLEAGAMIYEIAKRDGSAASFLTVHNSIGMAVIDALGDEEQKERFLPRGINFDKIFCFGLTEPENGSDASGLKTSARKVEGGWMLNGKKRWIGNATMGDVIVWARNEDDGGRIQAFIVEQGSQGFTPKKMEGKMALRVTQNAEFEFKDCFVPDRNKLANSKDFATGTNKILEASRIIVCWMAAGVSAGAYEAAIKYTTQRIQFGKPLAGFQLIQERLSRMMANTEFTISQLARLSQQFDLGKVSIGQIARAKANTTRLARETCAIARESFGGNGILLDYHVIKAMGDMEAMHTYEGTYDINMLISARELTGGIAAFK